MGVLFPSITSIRWMFLKLHASISCSRRLCLCLTSPLTGELPSWENPSSQPFKWLDVVSRGLVTVAVVPSEHFWCRGVFRWETAEWEREAAGVGPPWKIWCGEVILFLYKENREKAGGGNLEQGIEMRQMCVIHVGKCALFLCTVNRPFWLVGSNKAHAVR